MRSDDFSYHLDRIRKQLAEVKGYIDNNEKNNALAYIDSLIRHVDAGISVLVPPAGKPIDATLTDIKQHNMFTFEINACIGSHLLDRIREDGSIAYIMGDSRHDTWEISIGCHTEAIAEKVLRKVLKSHGIAIVSENLKVVTVRNAMQELERINQKTVSVFACPKCQNLVIAEKGTPHCEKCDVDMVLRVEGGRLVSGEIE